MTPSGKLDRLALPEMQAEITPENGRTLVKDEEVLCSLFAEVLDLPKFGPDDNFFKLGGLSLLAVQLISRVRSKLQLEVTIRTLFEAPTPAMLAIQLETSRPQTPTRPTL